MSNREFQIFIKPAGGACNLRCSYCYYPGKDDTPGTVRLMNDDILEKVILQIIGATAEDDPALFSWHGGEPLLAGLDFYRRAVACQKKHLPEGRSLMNGIQTNGTLLNEEWCKFFAAEKFFVGLSIDGPEEMHDRFRINSTGKPSFARVMNGHSLLREHGVNPEILCVVGKHNVGDPLRVYDFFRSLGAEFISFLPLVEKKENTIDVSDRSVGAKEFGVFLSEIFDEWVEKDAGRIKVQIFEEAIRTAFGIEHTLCIFRKECGGVPVIAGNGDFYSCDHFVNDSHLIGNIGAASVSSMLDSKRQMEFGRIKKNNLPDPCLKCEVLSMCNGECPKNRFLFTPGLEPGLNYLCEGYKIFFNHCKPFIDTVSQILKGS